MQQANQDTLVASCCLQFHGLPFRNAVLPGLSSLCVRICGITGGQGALAG